MKKPLTFILIAVSVIALVVIFNWPEADPPSPEPEKKTAKERPRPPTPKTFPSTITTLAVAQSANTLNTPETTIEEDFSTIELLLSQYRKHLGVGNPVGDNAEITAALLGRNSKGIAYLPSTGSFMDNEGRLIDRWGTPYFFHAISGEHMQIHSAGPDRKLHTSDDRKSEF